MSNSNNSNETCSNCLSNQSYSSLSNVSDYSCNQQCSCRYTNERSDKDKMYFNFFVLGKPMNLQIENYEKKFSINKERC